MGLVLLPFARVPAVLVAYVLVYGYAMGGNATLQATILGECFGRLHYGAIAGRMSPFIVLSQAAAVPFVGAIRDRTGTYTPAIALIVVLTLAAALCISRLRVPERGTRAARAHATSHDVAARAAAAGRAHPGTGGDSSV